MKLMVMVVIQLSEENIINSNSELVQHKPTTPNDLLKIKGIGEGKLKQYGKEILEVINEHLNNEKK